MEKIKELRERLLLSQAELANEIGVKKAAVSTYERGTRYPGWSTIRKILALADRNNFYLTLNDLRKKQD